MAKSIRNIFSRRQPDSPDLSRALERLSALGDARPDLAEMVRVQAALLQATGVARPAATLPPVTEDEARLRLQGGVPLLRNLPIAFDGPALAAQFGAICDALAVGNASDAVAVKQAVRRSALDVAQMATALLNGQIGAVYERAAASHLNTELLGTALRFTLLPTLAHLAGQAERMRQTAVWKQGYCPCCGGWPLLGEMRGLEQVRFLRCGLCATGWEVERLYCPACDTRNYQEIGYLHVEGDDQKRAVTCDACQTYFKVVSALVATPWLELPILDLETLHLDLIALERGFAPPA